MGIEGITVTAYRYEPAPPAGMTHYYMAGAAVSDANGDWLIENLTGGESYIYKFEDLSHFQYLRCFAKDGGGVVVTGKSLVRLEFENDDILTFRKVVAEDPPWSVDVTLVKSQRQKGSVKDSNGNGISGVTVEAIRDEAGTKYIARTETTDADGLFEIKGLLETEYYIFKFTPVSGSLPTVFYRGAGVDNVTGRVALAEQVKGKFETDFNYYDINVFLREMETQYGNVSENDGPGLEGIRVTAIDSETLTSVSIADSDANGDWTITGLSDGAKYYYQFRDLDSIHHDVYYQNCDNVYDAELVTAGSAAISVEMVKK